MPNPAAGVFKQLAYKVETTYGDSPTQASAQSLRRVQSSIDLTKETYQSNEIRTDQQMADLRHGVRRVSGKLSGELSPKTYRDFFAWALKKDMATPTALTGATITIGAPSSGVYPISGSGYTMLAGGFKVGHVFRFTAGALAAANQNVNLMITDITSETAFNVIPLNGKTLTQESGKTGCTLTFTGQQTYTPQSSHTDKSFALEHWYSDLSQSELFLGCKVAAINLSLPPTGLATIEIDVAGKDFADTTAKRGAVALGSQYFTSPTAATTTGLLAAVNGKVLVGGSVVANVTGMQMAIQVASTGDPVVGSNLVPFQFAGRVLVSGQMSVYFDSVTMRDAFVNETEQAVIVALTSDNTDTSDFVTFVMPRCKFGGAQKNDGEVGLVQTVPFQALLNSAGGTGIKTEKTTLLVQDSAAP
jgi:hypothetical protein